MKHYSLTYLLLFTILTSCAVQVQNVELKRRIYEDVPLNTILKNEIGDKLIQTGEEDYQDALKILETPNLKFNTIQYPYKKGDIVPLSGSTNEYYLYYNKKDASTYTSNYYFGIAISKKDPNIILPFVYSAVGGLHTKRVDGFKTKSDTFVDPNCTNCFKQEFIFNGKVSSSLKFIYREYVNDMARPAFNQELQYDLNESNIIGFKGLRLEVVNVTNTNIDYKILSSFNKK